MLPFLRCCPHETTSPKPVWNSLIWLDWLVREPPGPTHPPHPQALGLPGNNLSLIISPKDSKIKLRALCLHSKHFTELSSQLLLLSVNLRDAPNSKNKLSSLFILSR